MIKIVLLIALQIAFAERMTPKVKVVPPISTKQIFGTTVYEGSVPLILEVDLPVFVYSPEEEDCRADDVKCYFKNSMHYLYRNVEEDLSLVRNETKSREERQAVAIAAATAGYFMGPAVKRITTALFGDDETDTRLNVMHDEFRDVIRKTEEYSMHMKNVMEEAKKKIMDNSKALTHLEQTFKDYMKGIFDVVQAKSLNAQFHQAVAECLSQRFPASIVPLKRLKVHLTELENELRLKKYKVAIGLDDVSIFSKLPLSDCFIIDSVMKIVVNVPVVAVDTNWVLFEVMHNKFSYKGQVCEVYPSEAMFVATDRTNDKTVMITRNLLQHCSPYQNKICLVPRFSRDSGESLHCVKIMLQNEPVQYLKAHCGFRCSFDTDVGITQSDEGTILITNANNVTIDCGSTNYHYEIPAIGSLELRLGCSCSTYVNNILLDNPLACFDKEYYVHDHIKLSIPSVWTNLDNLIQGSKSEHSNLTEILDDTWHSIVPVFNFTTPANVEQDKTGIYLLYLLAGVVALLFGCSCVFQHKTKNLLSTLFERSETFEMIENILNQQNDKGAAQK